MFTGFRLLYWLVLFCSLFFFFYLLCCCVLNTKLTRIKISIKKKPQMYQSRCSAAAVWFRCVWSPWLSPFGSGSGQGRLRWALLCCFQTARKVKAGRAVTMISLETRLRRGRTFCSGKFRKVPWAKSQKLKPYTAVKTLLYCTSSFYQRWFNTSKEKTMMESHFKLTAMDQLNVKFSCD